MARDVAAVVAAAYPSRGIGYKGKLPWKSLPPDMKRFKDLTSRTTPRASPQQRGGGGSSGNDPSAVEVRNAVVMGRKTWESIPPKFRPLPGRWNVVLTSDPSAVALPEDDAGAPTQSGASAPSPVRVETDLEAALEKLHGDDRVDRIFVIGGGQVYRRALDLGLVNRIYYTEVANLPGGDGDCEGPGSGGKFDTYFPELDDRVWRKVDAAEEGGAETVGPSEDKENGSGQPAAEAEDGFLADESSGLRYRFVEYRRRNVEELQYLDLCRDVMETGVRRGDRTGTGTLSKFGAQMRFSLRGGRLPLLTTKRTFWRGVAEELLWFISGCTNANVLAEKDIHIWDGNGSREFLDQRGLGHREVGDLGPVYGFQWRHFGATYVDMRADYAGQGVDQLRECIDKIVNSPEDRRIVMSAWNPADLELMALPPCHMFCQFYVDTERNELSCQMYQRSADLGLGVPFNIASYALLTHLVAHVSGRKPGDFVHTIGDAHVYLNHVGALREQIAREPRDFPTLRINPAKTDIDDFALDDLVVEGYDPHKTIKMKMAV